MVLIPPSFKFKGNKEKSISLKAQALQFYNYVTNQAEIGGISFIHKTLILSDGSSITITSKKNDIYDHRTGSIIINTSLPVELKELGDIYVESGFLDLLSSAQCSENTYRPSVLKYNTYVSSYVNNTITPIQGKVSIDESNTSLIEYPYNGEVLLDNSESKSVGCSEKLPSISTCDTVYSNGGYCSTSILMKKKCQSLIPSSLFSGKIRLLIQAIYGSTRSDYSCEWDSQAFDYSLKIGNKKLSPSVVYSGITGNHFLITHDNEYFIGEMRIGSLNIYRTTLSDTAKRWLSLIPIDRLSDRYFTTKVETYVLSTLTIGELYQTLEFTAVDGQPLFYGWAFSWDGLEGHIVLHSQDIPNKVYKAKHYKSLISVTYDVDNKRVFSVDVAQQSEEIWWPVQSYVYQFKPEIFISDTLPAFDQIPPIPYKGLGTSGVNSFNSKIYGYSYYDFTTGADDFVFINQSLNVTVYSPSQTIIRDDPIPILATDTWKQIDRDNLVSFYGTSGLSISGSSSVTLDKSGLLHSASYLDIRYYIPAQMNIYEGFGTNISGQAPAIANVTREAITDVSWQVWMVSNGYWYSSSGYHSNTAGTTDCGDGTMTPVFYGCKFYSLYYDRLYEIKYDPLDMHVTFIEPLLGDCSSVLVGTSEFHGNSSHTLSVEYDRVKGPHGFKVVTYYYNQFGQATILNDNITDLIEARYTQWQFFSVTGVPLPSDENKRTDSIYVASTQLDQVVNNVISSNATAPTNWHFNASITLKQPLGSIETARQSILSKANKADIIFGGLISLNNNYASDNSIGWA